MNDKGISFNCENYSYYLDWSLEPVTTLYSVFQLNDTVDMERAKEVALFLNSSCESLSVQLKEDRQLVIGCTTIVVDMDSLWKVFQFLMTVISNALSLFFDRYEKGQSGPGETN